MSDSSAARAPRLRGPRSHSMISNLAPLLAAARQPVGWRASRSSQIVQHRFQDVGIGVGRQGIDEEIATADLAPVRDGASMRSLCATTVGRSNSTH